MISMKLVRRGLALLPLAFAGMLASTPAAESRKAVEPASSMIRYERGALGYYALSLKAGGQLPVAVPHDYVVVVDTSASQAGGHRAQSLSVLESFLKALGAEDRVSLQAVDVKVQPQTDGFVRANSPELEAGLAKLKKRIPLGATNLLPALSSAVKAFDGTRPAGVIYIGDGMSSGRLIDADELRTVIAEFKKNEIPVHGLAVGPKTDLQLLGLLANHTGGMLLVDELIDDRTQKPTDVGRRLAEAAAAPVYYPTKVTTTPELPNLLPALAPIRMDRETVLLGQGVLEESVTITVESKLRGSRQPVMKWTIKPTQAHVAHTFLAGLWSMAERDNGLSMPVAGNDLLNFARQSHEDRVGVLAASGIAAVATRNLKQAQQIAWAIRQLDPENVEAESILNKVKVLNGQVRGVKAKAHNQVALAQDEKPEPKDAAEPAQPGEKKEPAAEGEKKEAAPEEPPVKEKAPPAEGEAPAKGEAPAEGEAPVKVAAPAVEGAEPVMEGTPDVKDAIAAEKEAILIRTQIMQKVVTNAMERSDKTVNDDPDLAIKDLKSTLNSVESASDIDPDAREKLRRRLQNKILAVTAAKIQKDQLRIEGQRRAAQAEAERRAIDLITERDEKLERRIEQVKSLMTQGFLGNEAAFEEAEAVARLAWELAPYSGVTSAAIFDAEAAGQLDAAQRIRALRNDKFLATLTQVELAHVPFPDEPPVLFPPPEVWSALTQRRKKWESVDLMRSDPIEERIRRTLDASTTVEFEETPFADCITFLKEQHNINIILDDKAIADGGMLETNAPITLKLSGISLRSVLKLLLEQHGLRYIIKDQVMQITTKDKADADPDIRVYYVGDLVIPVFTPQSAGIGQGLGGVGGFGGSQGSMGGGQFGIGGGGGANGFGGGGGGMGMFNVADEPATAADAAKPGEFNNDTVKNRKKKLIP